jgi:hypothetical protein
MRLPLLLCAALWAGLTAGMANAAKLDKPICDDLKVELGLLQQKGLPAVMARGPEWAKGNLSRERLKEIERLIHVEEQLAFRCPLPKRQPAPGEEEDGTVAAAPAKGAKSAQAKTSVPKAAKSKPAAVDEAAAAAPPAKKAVKAAPVRATAQASEADAPAPRKVAPPKSKAKVDDAYTPPPGATASSPFTAVPK